MESILYGWFDLALFIFCLYLHKEIDRVESFHGELISKLLFKVQKLERDRDSKKSD